MRFSDDQLRCRCCGLLRLHPGFRGYLDTLSDRFGEPMEASSCCRCAKRNAEVGGHPRSLHVGDKPFREALQGSVAMDITTPDPAYRGRLFALAWELGWSIGWGKGFLHLDRREMAGLPQATFDY